MKNRKRNRMVGYDYSRDNLYFVTICVNNKKCCLGSIGAAHELPVGEMIDGAARELPVREMIDEAARELPVRVKIEESNSKQPRLILNEYGIIVEERILWLEKQYKYVRIHNYVVMPNHVHLIIEINRQFVNSKAIKIKSLSSLMGAFKTTSSKLIHLSGFYEFSWQRSFHDSIIRSKQGYLRISKYIDSNPEKWFNKSTF